MNTDPGLALEDVARHESGHAVAHWMCEVPFSRLVLLPPAGPYCYPAAGARKTGGQHWLIAAAGAISEYMGRGWELRDDQVVRLLLGHGGDTFVYHDTVSGAACAPVRRSLAVAPEADLHHMVSEMTGPDRADWPPERCVAAWRSFEKAVAAALPAINAVAAVLLDRGSLGYADVAGIVSGEQLAVVLA